MAVYGPGCHPQNIIWTEAKLKFIYYFVGDRPVYKLPFGTKCYELFVILYSIHANLSDDMVFFYCISKTKNEFGQNPEENIILIGPGQYIQINTWAFPYWPGYHPETPILARNGVEGQYGSRDDHQANMEMPMY